jgi:hypothetical protein
VLAKCSAISDALLVLMGDQMEVWLMVIFYVILTG